MVPHCKLILNISSTWHRRKRAASRFVPILLCSRRARARGSPRRASRVVARGRRVHEFTSSHARARVRSSFDVAHRRV